MQEARARSARVDNWRIGVDSQTGLAHRAVVTPANVHDKHEESIVSCLSWIKAFSRLMQPHGIS
jgi:hypothetical protein